MAEVVVNLQSENQDTKRLAKYECSKMNLSQNVTIGQIESEIVMIQNQLDNKIDEYENAVSRLENIFNILRNRISIVDGEELNLFGADPKVAPV